MRRGQKVAGWGPYQVSTVALSSSAAVMAATSSSSPDRAQATTASPAGGCSTSCAPPVEIHRAVHRWTRPMWPISRSHVQPGQVGTSRSRAPPAVGSRGGVSACNEARYDARSMGPSWATIAGVIVDYAVYTHGKRRSGELALDDALETCRADDTFVWIGLHEP